MIKETNSINDSNIICTAGADFKIGVIKTEFQLSEGAAFCEFWVLRMVFTSHCGFSYQLFSLYCGIENTWVNESICMCSL